MRASTALRPRMPTPSLRRLALLLLAAPALRAASFPPLRVAEAVVATPHGAASEAGLELLRQGGDAVDAAVGAMAALTAATPGSSGIGGGFFALVYRADEGKTYVLDAREVAPGRATRSMFTARQRLRPDLGRWGGLAVAVPGEVRGYEALHERWGKLAWSELFEPAAELAERGVEASDFLISLIRRVQGELRRFPHLARMIRRRTPGLEYLERFETPAEQRKVLREGRWPRPGERLPIPALARTLRELARRGPDHFYTGALGAAIVRAVDRHRGILTAEDLAAYRPVWREPVVGTFRNHQVISMPPPSSGGAVLIEILNVLDRFPLESMGLNSSAYLHTMAEALKHGFADRADFMGDPAFVDVPLETLLSERHATAIARDIHPLRTRPIPGYRHQLPEDGGTNHVVVVDTAGNVVSATSTINTAFGSLVAVPGRGFVLNNQMEEFASLPGARGEAGAAAPGKKPLSSMTPTLVLRGGKPVLALGGAGGPRIITGTLQTLLAVLVFGRDVQQALDAPRIHHQWSPPELVAEDALAPDVLQALGLRGHQIERVRSLRNRVQVVEVGDGWLEAASDPREAGRPAGY